MNNGLTAATTISPKQYQIHNSLDRLQEAVDRQEVLRNDLFYRLDTVMRPSEPCDKGKAEKPSSGIPLCLRIDALTDRLASNNDALKDILDRLEVWGMSDRFFADAYQSVYQKQIEQMQWNALAQVYSYPLGTPRRTSEEPQNNKLLLLLDEEV